MASYARFDGELEGEVGGILVEGNRPDNSPEWTASFAAQVDIPLPNGSSLGLRADYHGRSEVFDGPFEEAETIRPGVDIVGAASSGPARRNCGCGALGQEPADEEVVLRTARSAPTLQ